MRVIEKIMGMIKVIMKKVMKILEYLKGIVPEFDNKKIVIIILIIESGLIVLFVLPKLIYFFTGIMRSSIVIDPQNYIIYRCISMVIMYSISKFLRKTINDLVENYFLFTLVSVTCTCIVLLLLHLL